MIPLEHYTPKHARTQYDALVEKRVATLWTCPGRHCVGGTTHRKPLGVIHPNALPHKPKHRSTAAVDSPSRAAETVETPLGWVFDYPEPRHTAVR